MKKFLIPAVALAAVASLGACSSDEALTDNNTGDGVSITLKIPSGMATRGTFGDGTDEGDAAKIDNLQYTVYEVGSDGSATYVYDETVSNPVFTTVNGMETTTVNLNLAKGRSYKLAFFADNNADNFVTYDGKTGTLSVNYANGASNVVNEDCFVGTSNEINVTDAVSESVVLNRPFAQINWGTDDINTPALKNLIDDLKASVTVSAGLYSDYNVITGEYSNEVTAATTFAEVPVKNTLTQTFPVQHENATKVYKLIAMNYLLTGDGTIDCTLDFGNTVSPVVISAAPVKVNYRTNIYGSLLTAPADFRIAVNREFAGNINYPVKVETPEDFVNAVASGLDTEVDEGVNIDLKDQDFIELTDGQSIIVNGTINTKREQISISGEGNVAYVTGNGTISSVGITGGKGSRPLNAFDGATLIVSDVTIETEQNDGGSAIFTTDSNLELDNVSINCHNFAISCTGGTLKMKNCNIYSDSSTAEGAHSYTVYIGGGCQATLDNNSVTGIQGGLSIGGEGSVATINGGVYQTVKVEGKGTPHYPVYIYDKGVVIVNDGQFISAHSMNYTIFNGNNDVPEQYAWGNGCVLKGGLYNGPTLDQSNHAAYPAAEGYSWVEIDGPAPFKYQVVKD